MWECETGEWSPRGEVEGGRNWDTECHESKAVFVGLIALKRNVSPMFSNTRQGKEKLGEAICLELKV